MTASMCPSRRSAAECRARRLTHGVVGVLVGLLAVTGCGQPRPSSSIAPEGYAEAVITIHDQEIYTHDEDRGKGATFHGDGRIDEGVAGVTDTVSELGRVSPDIVRELVGDLLDAGFFDMERSYDDINVLDGSVTTVSLSVDGRSGSVADSNRAGPQDLVRIEDELRELVESAS